MVLTFFEFQPLDLPNMNTVFCTPGFWRQPAALVFKCWKCKYNNNHRDYEQQKSFCYVLLMKMDAGLVPPIAKQKKEVNKQIALSNPLL